MLGTCHTFGFFLPSPLLRFVTGTVNLVESTRPFSNQKTHVSDVMLLAEHKGSVHVRCGNLSLIHLTKPLSRKVPYLIYVLPRYADFRYGKGRVIIVKSGACPDL